MTNDLASTFTPPHPLNTAVLFLVFNRLDTTKQVFEAIRAAKPPRLYIAADGARESREGESEKVKAIRDYVLSHIDWKCEVKTLFREQNLGCKYAVSSAITWFFENEEMGIILEDDCLPSQSFFWFCEELLERYNDDMRVCSISGNLRENQYVAGKEQLYKSIYFNMWGWATWRRQWKNYDAEFFNDINNIPYNWDIIFSDKKVKCYWHNILKFMLNYSKNSTWDYQMSFISFINKQYSIYPSVNLVKNLGFGDNATHTFDALSIIQKIEHKEMIFENNNKELDDLIIIDSLFHNEYSCKSVMFRIIKKIKRLLVPRQFKS